APASHLNILPETGCLGITAYDVRAEAAQVAESIPDSKDGPCNLFRLTLTYSTNAVKKQPRKEWQENDKKADPVLGAIGISTWAGGGFHEGAELPEIVPDSRGWTGQDRQHLGRCFGEGL